MNIQTKITTTTNCLIDRTTEHARRVVSGEFVAGPHVRNACRRHLDDLEHGHERGLYFDVEAAERVFKFFETKLKLSEGQFENRPFLLHEAQAFILGSLYGWKKEDGFRRFRRAFIEQGKGNGKSPLAGGIGLYGLTADREPGAQIYAAAAKKEQADILFRDAVKMRDKSPEIAKRIVCSGGPGKEYNMSVLKSGSFFRPISREAGKTGSGPRPHYALCDEVHELNERAIIDILERGFKFRQQPLILMITNSGSDRNTLCWEEHEHAVKVAAGNHDAKDDDAHYLGEVIDDTTFSYVCALDKDDDPLNDESCWPKANPLLGVTITVDYLRGVVAQAKAIPGKRNGILRLHFCQWTDAATAWITRDLLEPALEDFEPEDFRDEEVFGGLDLSGNKDFTAMAFCARAGLVEDGKHAGKQRYRVWCLTWTPEDTLQVRSEEDKMPHYLTWAQDGWLEACPGKSISYRHVAQALSESTYLYDVRCLAYDRYAFKRGFEPECEELGIQVEFIEHPQGGVKKGKPTESMIQAAKDREQDPEGLWMPGSVRFLEELLLEGRLIVQNNPVLISAMMSCVQSSDRWGNSWLDKDKSFKKIDPAVAVAMAVGAARAFENVNTKSVYEDRGALMV